MRGTTAKPVILFRKDYSTEQEYSIARRYVSVLEQRTACKDALVIGRYSVLPYYQELERDLALNNCHLINSFRQHSWIADFEYYDVLKDYTPETWDDYTMAFCQHPGPFVVKGKTNSRKHEWNKLMFAETRQDALRIGGELFSDGLIGQQDIIYRKFVPLKVLEVGMNGLPFSNEWRFFYLDDQLLSYGYYWSIAQEETIAKAEIDDDGMSLANEIARIAKKYVSFFVLDIAQTQKGQWMLIEVNDGQMSGLSMNDPDKLYSSLKKCLEGSQK